MRCWDILFVNSIFLAYWVSSRSFWAWRKSRPRHGIIDKALKCIISNTGTEYIVQSNTLHTFNAVWLIQLQFITKIGVKLIPITYTWPQVSSTILMYTRIVNPRNISTSEYIIHYFLTASKYCGSGLKIDLVVDVFVVVILVVVIKAHLF